MINISNLEKKYKNKTVLHINSLSIEKGNCIGLVGNNGAGKTTLLSLMLDLIESTNGEVKINNENVKKQNWKSSTGSYLDEDFLIPYLTPKEYFEYIGKLHKVDKEAIISFMNENKSFFDFEEMGKKTYIRDLSKGNTHKVGILATMLFKPELIILDEPFANLDPTSQQLLKKKLISLHQSGTTLIVSSHDLRHLTEISDRIILLEEGKVKIDTPNNESMLEKLESYFILNNEAV
ncbi:ABC transporter ATP-binding protein [Aureibacter tunicatorum]|uniref:ABC-2 type transport system ATP-binding protein n=1 Tax=Aureibacter tunicatorum TaxID=866807 RepID=A0AAE3XJC4_9BACT|nr:ABC transporter ATP-binding protein [Aureibacter tunicatorum]MDR6237470.1 ABC-2 type transport system ATP-binding protein [Aureibacter tunicatorum]BDD06459.1 ATP-binding protein [Aureibacter tunicatorum]